MRLIESKNAPEAIGPYSQAYEAIGFVFVSGQLPIDPSNGNMPETIKEQAERSCKNIKAILKEADVELGKVIKTTCFLTDMEDFTDFNEVYSKYFTSKPARSCFAVKELPKGAKCEIEVIAVK